MLGFFVVALDAQIVNVALPEIHASLGGGLCRPAMVVTGYTLTFLLPSYSLAPSPTVQPNFSIDSLTR